MPGPPRSSLAFTTRAGLGAAIDSMVTTPAFRTAQWGILIIDPIAGDTLYTRNAAKLFIPASNQKLVTSSVMLERLGPEYRFRTTIGARGAIIDGALNGDLAVIGHGDPTASNHMQTDAMIPLRAMADSLWQRGVRRVTGDIVAAGDAFPGPVAGYGWPWDGLDGASFAGVDELLFNEGLIAITVRAGTRAGDPPTIETAPAKTYPTVRVEAQTVAAGSPAASGRARLSAFHDTATSLVVIRGTIAAGDSATLTLAQHDPDAAYLAALGEALRDRGITVQHLSPAASPASPQRIDTLFTMRSVPLRDILPNILKPSQNQIAEVFLRTLGLEGTGVGTADSGRRVIERQFADWKIPADAFVVRDGSGLSRNDLISPEAIVDILDVMRRSPNFNVFYESLPIAGVDGTIRTRMRNTAAQGNLHAKTGTLSMVRSLSGYVRTADARLLEFSILCNNWTVAQAEVDRVADAIGAALAGMRLR